MTANFTATIAAGGTGFQGTAASGGTGFASIIAGGSSINIGASLVANTGGTNAGVYGSCGSDTGSSLPAINAGGAFSDGNSSSNYQAVFLSGGGATVQASVKGGIGSFVSTWAADGANGHYIGGAGVTTYGVAKSASGSSANLTISANGTAIVVSSAQAVRFAGAGYAHNGIVTSDASGNLASVAKAAGYGTPVNGALNASFDANSGTFSDNALAKIVAQLIVDLKAMNILAA
jgi:hypothetical protein